MAFKHNASTMMGRYNQHQSLAKSRLAKTAKFTPMTTPAVSMMRLDTKNTHAALPKQTAPGVNKTQTIQTDINKSHGHPKQSPGGLNKKTLQPDLMGARAGVPRPGSR